MVLSQALQKKIKKSSQARQSSVSVLKVLRIIKYIIYKNSNKYTSIDNSEI